MEDDTEVWIEMGPTVQKQAFKSKDNFCFGHVKFEIPLEIYRSLNIYNWNIGRD